MDLQVFSYEAMNIRTGLSDDGHPLFVLADVCSVLEIANSRDASGRLDSDELHVVTTDTSAGKRDATAINESGLYSLILTSRKPEAKRFKKWITSEVLPSIRKTGSYSVKQPIPVHISQASSVYKSFRSVAKLMGLSGNQLTISTNRATKIVTDVDFQNFLGMDSLINESQEQQFTSTDLGARIGLSAMKFNKKLEQEGFQERQGMTWTPTVKGKPYAVLLDTAKKHSDGTPVIQVKWKESIMGAVV